MRTLILMSLCASSALAQKQLDPGRTEYERNCSVCHGGDAMGGEMGPGIAGRLVSLSDEQLGKLVHDGIPEKGMPGFPNLSAPDKEQLMGFLRTVKPRRRVAPVRKSIELADGKKLIGLVLNESTLDLQLRSDDLQVHLLRPEGTRYREVTSQTDWTTYNGDTCGNRYSKLAQIDKAT